MLATCAHLLLLIPAGIYAASIVYAQAIGAPLPAAYLFRALAPDRWLNVAALWLPLALLILCAFSLVVSWLLYWSPLREGARDLERRVLAQLRWSGLLLTILLLAFLIGSGGWSGFIASADVQYMAMAGLVPYSDALGYVLGTFHLAADGRWDWISGTRPLAATFRNLITLVSGYGCLASLAVQLLLLSSALYFATRNVGRWIGLWAGAAFLAFCLFFIRCYLATAMTEPLALIWAFVAVGFLADALRCRSFPSAVAAILFMTLAQQTRMGAVFVLPMLGLWVLMAFSTRRTLMRDAAIVIAAVAAPVLLSALLAGLYGAARHLRRMEHRLHGLRARAQHILVRV